MSMSSTRRKARHAFALAALSVACAAATAAQPPIKLQGTKEGVTPFISTATFKGQALAKLKSVQFTIARQPGATAQEVSVQYTAAALLAHGYGAAGHPLVLPIYGLYPGKTNPVTVKFVLTDGTSQTLSLSIAAKAYKDPNKIYDKPTILTPRTGAPLGFSYMYLKSGTGSPVIIDIDGQMRWVGGKIASAFSSAFDGTQFVIGERGEASVQLMQLDGSVTSSAVDDPAVTQFNHNIVQGRDGQLAGVNRIVDGVENIQSTIAEMTVDGHVIREWDIGQILSDYMTANGDDPTQFVHPGVNWLHMNNSLYDATDNSLTISSREQFVMKMDYDTREIKWILGDPTKWWYSFPSLRAKAITLAPGDFYPIGQHDINKSPEGTLLLFNNGAPSYGLPPPEPSGESRLFSTTSAYTIDPVTMTGKEVYRYEHDRTIKSAVCSSVTEESDHTMMIDYASAEDGKHTHLVGLDAAGNIAFEYQYKNSNCNTAWNTIPISLEDLVITK